MQLLKSASQPSASIVAPGIKLAGNSLPVIVAIAIMLITIILMFNPIVFGGKTLSIGAEHCSSIMPGGAFSADHKSLPLKQFCPDPWAEASQTEPWLKIVGWSYFTEHKIPHWNPYVGCGMPFLANMQSQPFNPLHVLSSALPSNIGLNAFVLARLLVGGLCTFFALRFLLPARDAALFGAIGFMFTGYLLLYLNMSEISVAVLIPGLILGVEAVVRSPSVCSIGLCAGLVAVNLLGGMPESSFLAIVFAGFYVLARLGTLAGWNLRFRMLGFITLAFLAGLLIALPQVLPFLEYMRLSVNSHDPSVIGYSCGLDYDADWQRGALSYLFPVAWAKKYFAHGFYGVALGYLAMLGVCIAGWRALKNKIDRYSSVMMLFFGLAFLLMLLKRFGCPLVQWIGQLPLANMVLFPKYDEPVMALCVAALAAFAVSALQRQEVKPRYTIVVAVGFWLFASLLYLLYKGVPMIPSFDLPKDMGSSMKLGLGALCFTVLLALISWKSRIVRFALPVLLAIPVLTETYAGYMCQTFYSSSGVVDSRLDPFKGAPYLDFLKKNADPSARVIGLGGVLRPNWSAVFNVMGVGYQDALCPTSYSELLSALLPNPGMDYRGRGFDGTENCVTNLFGLRRFCALTSTKYILSTISPSDLNDLIVANAQKTELYASSDRNCYVPDALIDGAKQTVMFQHPDVNPARCAVKIPVTVPDSCTVLEVDFVRNPDQACPVRQTPIHGLIEVAGVNGGSAPERFTFVNSDRSKLHAMHYRFDVAKFAGKQVLISISSVPQPGLECSWEWVGWKKLRFHQSDGERCIYDREVKIHEVKNVIPHAAIYSSVRVADDDKAALNVLASERFSPLEELVFSKSELQANEIQMLSGLGRRATCREARITYAGPDQLKIVVPAISEPAVLLLTDNYYPGWKAFVDGKATRILKANHCFRALLLPAGANNVVFKYDPWLFNLGSTLCGFTLMAFLLAFWKLGRRELR